MATPKILLKRSSVAGRVPTAGDLGYGELAINFEDGKLYYKDASNNIKAFVDSARVQAIADAVEATAEAQLDSSEVTALIDRTFILNLVQNDFLDSAEALAIVDSAHVRSKIDAAFINSLSGVDADTLAGQLPSYYNNYANITGAPNVLDSADVEAIVGDVGLDSALVTQLIDSAYVAARFGDSAATATNAITLNGQAPSYYLDYNNLSNAPSVLDATDVNNQIDTRVDGDYVKSRAGAGPDNAVQYNNSGTIAGDSGMTYDAAADRLTVTNLTVSSNITADGLGLDSDLITQLIDSDYVRDRQSAGSEATQDMIDSSITFQVDSDYVRLRVPTDQELRTTSEVDFATVDAPIVFTAKNNEGSTITKGQVVYVNGVSGETPTVRLANAGSSSTMPAFGLAYADANNNSNIQVVTFGNLTGVDTSAFSAGDTLYISTTDGTLTNQKPGGEGNLVQNIGKVVRSHASSGVIRVGGAGRTNATPNLDVNQFFLGNDSNYAASANFPTEVKNVIDSAYVRLVAADQELSTTDSVTFSGLTVSGNLTVTGNTTEVNTIAYTVNDPLIHLADSNETSDVLDIGFLGHYYRDGQRRHTGVFRDASNEQYYMFHGMVDSSFDSTLPPNVIDRTSTDFTLSTLNVGTINGIYSGFDSDLTQKSTDDLSEGSTNLYYTTTRANTDIDARVDASYVQSRQLLIDSSLTTQLIDSAYIQLRQIDYLDSSLTIQLIDSAYVQARQTAGTDSAATIDLIEATVDSAYVQARVAAGTDSATVSNIILDDVDSAYVKARFGDSAANATTALFLGEHDSTFYLDYNNFTNTPTIPVQDKTNIDALNINADTLDGQHGTYYSNYNNLTNKPTILSETDVKNIFNSTGDNQLETERVVGLEYLEFVHDSDATTFDVEVASKTNAHRYHNDGSGNGYVIRSQEAPFIQLVPGNTYRFAQHNATNVGHPIRFYYDVDKTTEYTDGVTAVGTPGSAGAYTEIVVSDDTPAVLHYQCTAHGKMGNAVFVQTRNLTGFTTNDLTENTNLYYTNARVQTLVDSAYVAARQTKIDSALTTQLIDSAYINARASHRDSAFVTDIIDSAYIQARDRQRDSNFVLGLIDSAYVQAREATGGSGALLAFKQIFVNTQDSVVATGPNDTLTLEAGSNITLTTDADTRTVTIASSGGGGGGGNADGVVIDKHVYTADSNQTVFADSDDNGKKLVYNTVNSEVNVFLNGVLQVDSDDFTLTDSNTVTLTSAANSGDVVQVIRYTPPSGGSGGSGTVDSAQTINLITATVDSAYIQSRENFANRGTLEVNKFFFEADSGQTRFTGNDKFSKNFTVDPDNTEVYLNGILQELTTDYTINDSGVTFTEAVDSGFSVSVIETIGRVNTQSTITRTVFEYDADSAQTAFTGADRDGLILDLSNGQVSVHLNGILLSDVNDYTFNGSTLTLDDPADSGDFLAIEVTSAVVSSSLNTRQYTFTNQTGTTLSGNGLGFSGNVQVFKNGDVLRETTDYTTQGGNQINLTTAAISSDVFVVQSFNAQEYKAATFDFIATSGQTTFNGEDRHGNALKYSTGGLVVYLNGIALVDSADYTASNGTTLTLNTAADADDELKIQTFVPGNLASIAAPFEFKNFEYTADSGQSAFSGADDNGETLSYTAGKVNVLLNGLVLKSSDFTATNGTSVTLTEAADSGDILMVQKFVGNNIGLDSSETQGLINDTYVQGKVTESFLSTIIDSDYVSTRASTIWTERDASTTITANSKNIVDCSGSAINLTLPASPSIGDEVRIIDGTGNAATNNITLLRNGQNIQNADSDFIIDVDRAGIGLVYYNATQGWILIEN